MSLMLKEVARVFSPPSVRHQNNDTVLFMLCQWELSLFSSVCDCLFLQAYSTNDCNYLFPALSFVTRPLGCPGETHRPSGCWGGEVCL